MAYKVIILYRLYMPSYFLGTFTEYPFTRREPLKVRFTFYIKNELVLVGTFTFRFVQNDFTHTHALRSYFHVFIFLDVFQCFFQ